MKSNILFALLTVGMILPVFAMAQDVDRVNDLVGQALQMADQARQQGIRSESNQSAAIDNPFARSPQGIGVQGANGTRVGVDQNQIQIEAAGQRFNIPRTSNSRVQTPDTVDPMMAGLQRPRVGVGIGVGTQTRSQVYSPYLKFANATGAFRQGDFQGAKRTMAEVASQRGKPFDQFRSLCEFATGNYAKSAEYAYASVAQGQTMNWNQLRAYYGDRSAYSQQYQALQQASLRQDCNVSVMFLTGYHHLMLGHRSHAIRAFEKVLNVLPNDPVVVALVRVAQDEPPAPLAR